MPDQVDDRLDADAGRAQLEQELAEAGVPVLLVERAGAHERDHQLAVLRVAGPDLLAVDAPAAVRQFLGARAHRRQVRSGAGLRHADATQDLAARHAGQIVPALLLRAIAQQVRSRLAIRDPMRADRRTGREQLFEQHVAFERAALVAAVTLRPHHADPAARAELARELGIEHGPAVGATLCRHVRQLARQELANLFAKCGQRWPAA